MQKARTDPDSTASQVLHRIRAWGSGAVFVPTDFLDLGTRSAVDAALGRLTASSSIRRIGRGVYDFPKAHSRFGLRAPSVDAVAHAIARSNREAICHSPATAANMLGVSTQVPARATYLTDGTNRVFSVDLGGGRGFDITFKRSRRTAGADTKAGLVLRALSFLGRDGIEDSTVRQLRAALSDSDVRELARLRSGAVGWMQSTISKLVDDDHERAA